MDEVVAVDAVGEWIYVTASFRWKDAVKLVPGARYHAAERAWRVPLSWAACKALRSVFGDHLVVGPALLEWSLREYRERIYPLLILRDDPGPDVMWGFQGPGVEFLCLGERVILADEMGTGKTRQVVTALVRGDFEALPALVICPNSVKTVWRAECERQGLTATVVQGGAKARRDAISSGADVVIVNYEAMWRDTRLAPYGSVALKPSEKVHGPLNTVPWRTVVADEAHRMKDPKSKQTRGAWFLAHDSSVRYRYALTGTPIANGPDDLWSLLHFVDPRQWSSRQAFIDRFCLQAYSPFGGVKVIGVRPDAAEEFYATVHPFMRRMPKALVMAHLPPKVRSVRETAMTPKQAKAYKQMDEMMIAELEQDEFAVVTLPVTKRLRLMQFSSAYAELNDVGDVRLSEPSCKVDALVELIEELGGEQLVVFAASRQLIDLAAARLASVGVTHCLIVGGMTSDQREINRVAFQAGTVQVILLTFGAGAEGITLTAANHVCFMQRSDSMLQNKQAEDRVHRGGAEVHDVIHVVELLTPGTVEEGQVNNVLRKMAMLEEVVQDRLTLERAAAQGNQDAKVKLLELDRLEADLMKDVDA